MKAVLYARVSSQEQANKGYSLQDQQRTPFEPTQRSTVTRWSKR